MKTIFVTLILLCGFVSPLLASDPMVVDKLIHKTTDLSASNVPKDMNGTPCGLLKVITDDKSMTFEGSVIGIPEYKNGEYWVYIPEGTYQIRIKASQKEPVLLNFRDYNLNHVRSKSTYELSFKQQQDASNIYLTNAYTALNAGQLNSARKYYQRYKEISGNSDRLFETEMSKADGTYIWSEKELLAVGFRVPINWDDHFNEVPRKFAPISVDGKTGLIEDLYKECKVISGNVINGYVNGLVLLKDHETYTLAYVCQGKLMAPCIRILEAPIMIDPNDPLKEERNCLYIDEDIVSNSYNFKNKSSDGNIDAERWLPYLKQIFTPDVTEEDFLYNFTLGEVDMELIKKNFSTFVRSGKKIPAHIWGRK